MKIPGSRLFKSFRVKILLSFFAFTIVLLVWISIYFVIKERGKRLQNFANNLTLIQNSFLENNRFLQYFILTGYHQPEFYLTHKQRDIDTFQQYMEENLRDFNALNNDARRNNIDLDEQLPRLFLLDTQLIDSVKLLKQLYLAKGFKDFGAEGKMRLYAHTLEDSALIPEVKLLLLRRHEKDYLIRGDTAYASQFMTLMDELIHHYKEGSLANTMLNNYKSHFTILMKYTNRLGVNNNTGVYNAVQNIINDIEKQYSAIKLKTNTDIARLQERFNTILVSVSALLIVVLIILSLYLSQVLSKDIRELTVRMSAFINSRFRENEGGDNADAFVPKIQEVDVLNRAFLLLKKNLKSTLDNLEKSYADAKKTSEYKSIFLANMSHEIRTPLNGITGMVHILKNSPLSLVQEDYVNTIEFSANHLMELINMILDYSKIESGNMELEAIAFNLEGDINKIIKMFEYKLQEKGLILNLHLKADTSHYIIGDTLRLQQVLINLLNNAIKFTEAGSIHFRIIQQSINEHRQQLRFEVEDCGIGISPDKIDSLFEAFKQADTSITRNFGGTGLGLTISDQLVKLMGGKLEVKSELGKGSVFFFDLDLKRGDLIRVQPEEKRLQHAKDFSGIKILLVEDNLINQKIIGLMLTKNKVIVEIANNGQEAIDMYAANDYDLVLMDFQMPVMDGLQATAIIRQSVKYTLRNTPIVAITAGAFNDDRIKAFDAGMHDFLSKPIKPAELEGILAKYFITDIYDKHQAITA